VRLRNALRLRRRFAILIPSMRRLGQILATGAAILASLAQPAGHGGQAGHSAITAIPLATLQRPVTLRDGIGIAREAVTTTSENAQRYYNQGLAQLQSFSWIEAARSFHAALRLDPRLAMAHIGLSFAFGELGSMDAARKAVVDARALQSNASARDRLRIALRSEQLDVFAGTVPAAAYRASLDRALAQFPDDVQLLLLRGQAADPPDGSGRLSNDDPAVSFFERATRLAPDQFASHHYLIHTYETAGRHQDALSHADTYVRMAPAVPHAHHMKGHGLRRLGRTGEAIVEFRKAADLEAAFFQAEKMPQEYDWHVHHNWGLLAASYRSIGQMRMARTLLGRAFQSSAPLLTEELTKREWPEFLLDRGAPNESITAARRLIDHASPLVRAAGHMATAHALLTQKKPAAAEVDAALRELRSAGPEAGELAPEFRLLQGEFFLRGGERDKGRAMIRQAAAELRARAGPDPWTRTLFVLEAAARAARDIGDGALASELAEEMRQHDPGYAGAHYALALGAESRGDRAAAVSAYTEAVRGWKDADADLPELIDAHSRISALSRP
jgi:tetratricopeptide (TPR) repeat protein